MFNKDEGTIWEDKIIFGGEKGLTIIDSQIIEKINIKPQLFFFELTIGTTSYDSVLFDPDIYEKSITIPYDYIELNYVFLLPDFRNPSLSWFSAILDGNDEEWSNSLGLDYTYYDLEEPGEYTIKVKGFNHLGVWCEKEDTFTIIIEPPFWKTG